MRKKKELAGLLMEKVEHKQTKRKETRNKKNERNKRKRITHKKNGRTIERTESTYSSVIVYLLY
jgi:hypothetical protein